MTPYLFGIMDKRHRGCINLFFIDQNKKERDTLFFQFGQWLLEHFLGSRDFKEEVEGISTLAIFSFSFSKIFIIETIENFFDNFCQQT